MKGKDAEAFGVSFQRQLVRATMEDPGLRGLVERFVSAGQLGWTDPSSMWAWQVIQKDDHPSLLKLKTERLRLGDDDPATIGASDIIEASKDWRDDDYVREQVLEWARRQVFYSGFEEAREAWNQGDTDNAMSRMMERIEEMAGMRLESADRGWFFSEFGDRQYRRASLEREAGGIPVGIDKIDKAMGGGLSSGELEVVMAYSGIGKTFWCVQRGFVASRIRKKTLHFVLEGGRGKTEDRYESRFEETIYSRVKAGDIDSKMMALMQREYRALGRNLVLRGFNDGESWRATYDNLLTELKTLRTDHGWVPDLVVVDYGDLLHADGESEYMRQKTSFRQLKALSERIEFRGHKGYAVCSPTQAVRPDKGADNREHVLRPRDVADCYEKVRVSDIILSLNRTLDEREQKLARVYLGKYRDAEDGALVRIKTDYERGGFSDLTYKGEPPPPPPKPST
jgi:replicative DNA helicase